MATQSPSPSTPPVGNPPSPGSETEKQVSGDGNYVKTDAANEFSGQPLLREDQVQNAVKFLSHPRVRSSPVIHRRSFLEKKGLTKEEIDEAFCRVPDPPSNATNGEAYPTSTAAMQQKSVTTLQHQDPVQTPQPVAAPGRAASMAPIQQLPRFHWSHALLAVGVISAAGAGTALLFKKMVIPRMKAWIKKVVAEESKSEKEGSPSSKLAEEAAEAAKAAASAAAVVAKASQALLSTKDEERKYFEAFMGALDIQVKEMKSMGDTIRRLENRSNDRISEDKLIRENIYSTTGNVRPASPPAFMESLSAPNQYSYTEVMSRELRTERPPAVKPLEAPQRAQQRPSYAVQSQSSEDSKTEEIYGTPSGMPGNAHDGSEAWWLKKSIKISEVEPEEERKQFNERPKQRAWLPPQPPAVFMPEAAAAIRCPKPLVQKQHSGDGQSVASSDDGQEGELRATDSVAEADNSGSIPIGTGQSEIQEEKAVGLEVSQEARS